MQRYNNSWRAAPVIFLPILLFLVVFFITPDTLIAKSKNNIRAITGEKVSPPVTGFIDRIGRKRLLSTTPGLNYQKMYRYQA